MNIEVGEILTLENDKEYIVVAKDKYQEKDYLFLMSNFTPVEVRFAKELVNGEDVKLEIVNNQNEKMELMKIFQSSIASNIQQAS